MAQWKVTYAAKDTVKGRGISGAKSNRTIEVTASNKYKVAKTVYKAVGYKCDILSTEELEAAE